MKLTYWVAVTYDDSRAYNVRERTKREAVAAVSESGLSHGPVHKVTVEYDDGFDLMDQCLSEGSGGWER